MRLFCFFIIPLFFLACQKTKDDLLVYTKTIELEYDNYVSVYNISNESIPLDIDINNKYAINIRHLIEKILLDTVYSNDEEDIIKAWRFVANRFEFADPLSSEIIYNDALLLYNSIGFGYCDDFAALLTDIFKEMGYPARSVNINEHVVTEVYKDGKWMMFDPMYYVYYWNREGRIASVEELYQDTTLIMYPYKKLDIDKVTNKENYHFSLLRYKSDMVRHYKDYSPKEYQTKSSLFSGTIDLPPKIKMEFPVKSPLRDIRINLADSSIYEKEKYVKFVIPKGFKGNFKIPFIISSINGDGVILMNQRMVTLSGFDLKLKYNLSNYLPIEFKVIKSNSEIVVYALINDVLFNDDSSNVFTFKSKFLKNVEIEKRNPIKFKQERNIQSSLILNEFHINVLEKGDDFEDEFYKYPFITNKDMVLMVYRFLDFVGFKSCSNGKEHLIRFLMDEKNKYPDQTWEELIEGFKSFKEAMIHFEEIIMSAC